MESQPQDPEIRNNPENFHPWRSRDRMTLGDDDFSVIMSA